jgi:predicted glycoside hydrolase/deacetylase ChbG (UPF0249 family)
VKKQLVLNIDDVGSSQSANAAMVQAFSEGVATSCSLMVPCAWFADAAALAKQHRIPMGVHLVISCEYERYAFGPLTREPRLSRGGKGRFFDKSGYQFPKEYEDIVFAEAVAQIECALDHGVTPTHLDSHMCTIPRWDDAFAGVCDRLWERFRIPMREVRGGDRPAPAGMRLPIVRQVGFGDPSFEANKRKLRQHLEACVPGRNWVLCHAAKMSPELQALALDDGFAATRDNDLRVLCDPEVRAWIRELDLELVGVAQAVAGAAAR